MLHRTISECKYKPVCPKLQASCRGCQPQKSLELTLAPFGNKTKSTLFKAGIVDIQYDRLFACHLFSAILRTFCQSEISVIDYKKRNCVLLQLGVATYCFNMNFKEEITLLLTTIFRTP